jgi:carboxypeptidase Taq
MKNPDLDAEPRKRKPRSKPRGESTEQRYARLIAELRRQFRLGSALQLLEWDQETLMPAGALHERAQQIGTLAVLVHEQQTAPAFLALVDELAADIDQLSSAAAVDVREVKRHLDRERALGTDLVRARSVLQAEARAAWVSARRENDFAALAPYLEQLFILQREVAQAIAPERDAYDVLLEEHERGATRAGIERTLQELRDGLLPIIQRLSAHLEGHPPAVSVLCGHFPLDAQRRFNRRVVETLGFDFNRGRLDESAHPFTIGIGGDVRLTTRYDERDLRCGLFSSIHEAGHGIYEQAFDPATLGTPRGTACSFGVHESQSRLWENVVARSDAFWRYWHPRLGESFPSLAGCSFDALLLTVNEARPSLIRVEADEITYNLHIILRFELECAMLDGSLTIDALPDAWTELSDRYLGIVPQSHRDGVLQDVHWASGDIGYFPTYALGNIYAAQLWRAAELEIDSLENGIARGEFRPLVNWLRENVHRHGQSLTPHALIEAATGEPPCVGPLLEYLHRKVDYLESV